MKKDLSSTWKRAADLMATLDSISRENVIVIVKIDGVRSEESAYTVVMSGDKLGGSFFRKDGGDVVLLIREAIHFYRSKFPEQVVASDAES